MPTIEYITVLSLLGYYSATTRERKLQREREEREQSGERKRRERERDREKKIDREREADGRTRPIFAILVAKIHDHYTIFRQVCKFAY